MVLDLNFIYSPKIAWKSKCDKRRGQCISQKENASRIYLKNKISRFLKFIFLAWIGKGKRGEVLSLKKK